MIEKLNERITIERSTVVTDKVGNHRNTWGNISPALPTPRPIRRRKKRVRSQPNRRAWCFRYAGAVRPEISHQQVTASASGSRLYNIESVDPMNYQKKILKIHCRLERRQPDEQNRQHR
ncbi:MAG: head-tail adaptor protein [Lachnospiraceae bacterium]